MVDQGFCSLDFPGPYEIEMIMDEHSLSDFRIGVFIIRPEKWKTNEGSHQD